jgi:hypothetical protein
VEQKIYKNNLDHLTFKILLHFFKFGSTFFTPFLISNAHFVGVNELKGNVAMRISNAQRCKG